VSSAPSRSSLAAQHRRFQEQARWTAAARQRLFEIAALEPGSTVLEVGSGTGVISGEIASQADWHTIGLDLDFHSLQFAQEYEARACYLAGDGRALPFASACFDAVCCHFLLLWIDEPLAALHEMLRTLRPGAPLLLLAEPDYGGRLDEPGELARLGELQAAALEAAGADPNLGRRLRTLLNCSGAVNIFSGVLGGEWLPADIARASRAEREILSSDLAGRIEDDELQQLLATEEVAAQSGDRTLFVPTFFALGYAPG